ncbi:dATP pyrophosphohydrolase [Nitrospirillum sp. BR 11828]|uniref:dATP pyrophosphohydrolase n=1 Tax=Nitrospirillum sp. BR 11828 TaxID=3104325 RepID=UPI002ACA9ACB|nr:dATP pyrophosphohydrolase [Nitrospirillum sp. BR 11828]MDZ5645669.1 dATP pyrophosphohydrolase [Nitrospirillum sp. BR 11828]
MSSVEIIPVAGAALLDRFIRLPERLHKDDPHYIAPLHLERKEALTSKNPFFGHADVQFWLARRDGRDVGRISAQIDHHARARDPGVAGQFGMIAAEDDATVVKALLETAAAWLRSRGMTRMQGPFNLNINEEIGLLVDGFDTPPMLLMGHDKPYLGPRLEEQGLGKDMDVYAYIYDITQPLPAGARRLIERPLPKGLTVRRMDFKRYDDEIRAVTSIFNDAWQDNWGFVPLTEIETDHLAKSLRPLLDPRLVRFVEMGGQPVGFIVCLPNLNEAIRDLNGRLLPFGWAKLLWRMKVAGLKSARVPLMGIRKSASQGVIGSLLPFLLIDAVRKDAAAMGFQQIELSWILENNMPMRRINESLGGVAYKTYRIYGQDL